MIMDLNRTIAYICPMCSAITTKKLSVFDFSGRKTVVCSCGNETCSEPVVKLYEKKGAYGIEVECPVCDETHGYTLKQQSFWTRKLLRLACPASNINIFFAGDEAGVSAELDKHSSSISELLEDMDIEDELNLMYDLIDCINELSKINGISCVCGSHNINISAEDRQIVLTCRECGKQKRIEASFESLLALLNTSTIVLDDTNLDHE